MCIICKLHEAQKDKTICEQCENDINNKYDKEDDRNAI